MVNNEDVEFLDQFIRDYREGKVRGLALTYETENGSSEHRLLGEYADNLVAAANQVRRLDLALNRHFLRGDS